MDPLSKVQAGLIPSYFTSPESHILTISFLVFEMLLASAFLLFFRYVRTTTAMSRTLKTVVFFPGFAAFIFILAFTAILRPVMVAWNETLAVEPMNAQTTPAIAMLVEAVVAQFTSISAIINGVVTLISTKTLWFLLSRLRTSLVKDLFGLAVFLSAFNTFFGR
jgi:hypothetical protein